MVGEEIYKIWVEKEIVNVELIKSLSEKDIEELFKKIGEILKNLSGKTKILVTITKDYYSTVPSSQLRKEMVKKTINLIRAIGIPKTAIFGGNVMTNTMVSFILAAAKIKNVKFFSKKEQALKWLNQS